MRDCAFLFPENTRGDMTTWALMLPINNTHAERQDSLSED